MKAKSYLKSGMMVALFAISAAANAGFIGKTVQATALFPSLTTPTVTGGPISKVVGPGIEFNNGDFGAFFGPSFDFADTTITITHAATSHSAATFNGYKFFDVLGAISTITSVTILSDSTGFFSGDPSRVFFDGNDVFVNFQSLNFAGQVNPTIVLSVGFAGSAVPEPLTIGLFGIGLLGLGLARRKKA